MNIEIYFYTLKKTIEHEKLTQQRDSRGRNLQATRMSLLREILGYMFYSQVKALTGLVQMKIE